MTNDAALQHVEKNAIMKFSKVDFVEFVRRRDLPIANLEMLLSVQIFVEIVAEFFQLAINLESAVARIEAELTEADLDRAGLSRWQLPKVIAYVAYCADLPENDGRHIKLPARHIDPSHETRTRLASE